MEIGTPFLIASLFMLGAVCQLLAWRIRLPAILLLLLAGIALGPVAGAVDPDALLGELLFPFVSLSVAIILFEGSLTLRFREIKGLHAIVRNLVSVGMVVTWLITTLAARTIFDLSWEVAALFGAVMVVTGPTVIAPILRTVRPVAPVANILKWESIVIDPIGASLAILIYEFIISGGGGGALGPTLTSFAQLIVVGSAIGMAAGYLLGNCLRYHIIPEFLHNFVTLGLVFASFALANSFQAESGLVTVTVFGIFLANMKNVDLEPILAFKETLSIVLISLLFITLAARIGPETLEQMGWKALLICLVIQFVARPVNVLLSTRNSSLTTAERVFLGWIAPRGIVAAAISSLFALKLQGYGHTDAALLVPLTFTVIIFTVLLQSLTAYPLARILKITLPEREGFLIVGANRFSRNLAHLLTDLGARVILTDHSRRRVSEARREGIVAYRTGSLSDYAENPMELLGLGKLLALSEFESDNVAALFHYRHEVDAKDMYLLTGGPPTNRLFDREIRPARLKQLLDEGGVIRQLRLHGKFKAKEFHSQQGQDALVLFAVDPKNTIHFFNENHLLQPDRGWLLYYIVLE